MKLDLGELARALGGNVIGGQVLAPGPGHSRDDRSLSILLSPTAREGILVFSHAGDGWRECHDHVMQQVGIAHAPERALSPHGAVQPARLAPANRNQPHCALAMLVWNEAVEPRGTLVERYLTEPKAEGGRALHFPQDCANRLVRYHARCPWRDDSGRIIRVPAMIVLLRRIDTDEPVAVQRRRLTPDGRKCGKPRSLGPTAGAVAKLDADPLVTQGLVLGEGVETCFTARELGLRPVWACAGPIAGFPLLSGIEALTLLAENDENGASARAVAECAERWLDAGRDVVVAAPRLGKDLNDALQEVRDAAFASA